jgi:hypothetical protein
MMMDVAREPLVMRSHLVVFVAACALLVSACLPETRSVTSISLDFPHGETRLLIRRDDDALLFYGALPTSRAIKDGTFDIDQIYGQLKSRLYEVAPAEARPLGRPYGMAMIGFSDGSSRDYLVYDGEFAEGLFVAACRNPAVGEESTNMVLERTCAQILGAAP